MRRKTQNLNNYEITSKSLLAKLLATENITVIHAGTKTASFYPEKRILTLPIWKDISNDLYDLFVGHEVGHALYTPQSSLEKAVASFNTKNTAAAASFLNIVEDARIERMMKNRYPGLKSNFIRGYQDLLARDFFGINQKHPQSASFIDRINLHFKLGESFGIHFSKEEMVFVERIKEAVSWDDVVSVTVDIWNFSKTSPKTDVLPDNGESKQQGVPASGKNKDDDDLEIDPDAEPSNDSEERAPGKGKQNESNEDSTEDGEDEKQTGSGRSGKIPEKTEDPAAPVTDSGVEKGKETLIDPNAKGVHYLGIPTPNLSRLVDSWKTVQKDMEVHYNRIRDTDWFKTGKLGFEKFKEENKPVIDWMVREFEVHKAAEAYRRTQTAKTGVLDTGSLYRYKVDDDLFKRVSTVVGGQNHAMVVFLDWSGSIQEHLVGMVQQVINLVMFARRQNIPFEVYTFGSQNINSSGYSYRKNFTYVPDDYYVDTGNLKLRQVFSDQMNARQFNMACEHLWLTANSIETKSISYTPPNDALGGTPLNPTIITARTLANNLRTRTRVSKMSIIFVTDGGDTSGLSFSDRIGSPSQINFKTNNVILHDKQTKLNYNVQNNLYQLTGQFLSWLKDSTDATIVGFYITDYDDFKDLYSLFNFGKTLSIADVKLLESERSKTNAVVLPAHGYDEFYVIPGGKKLKINASSNVSSLNGTASNGQIVSALTKDGQEKKKQRIILTRFIKQIS